MVLGKFRMLRWWRWPAGLLVLIAIYALTGFYLVPHLARSQLERFVHEQLRQQISVGAIAFNPFTLIARVDHLDLSEADGTPIFHFDHLLVDAESRSLWHGAVILHEVRLEHPEVTILIDKDGRLNLAKLIPPGQTPAPPPKQAGRSKPIPIRIETFALDGGRIDFTDRSRPHPYSARLQSIQLAFVDFGTDPGHANAVKLSLATPNDEQLQTAGEITLQPLSASGSLSLAHFRLATATAWLQDRMPIDLSSGTLDLGLQYNFSQGDPLQLKLTAPSIHFANLALAPKTTPATAPWIRVPSVQIDGAQLSLADRSVSASSVEIAGSDIKAWREPDGTLSLQHLLTAAKQPRSAPASAPWQFKLGPVQVKETTVDFEDRAVTPTTRLHLSPVDITAKGISSDPAAKLTVTADLGIDRQSHLHADTDLQLRPLTARVKFDLRNFDLPPLQPYISQATAVTLLSGSLNSKATLDYASRPGKNQPQLHVAGDVEIDNLATKDRDFHQNFVKWDALIVSGLDYRKDPDSLAIDRIEALKPYGRVIIEPDQTLNVTRVLHPAQGSAHPETAGTAVPVQTVDSRSAPVRPPMPIRIGEIVIHEGSANFADRSIQPSFATGIVDLNGSVKGLSSDHASRADVNLTGQVDRYSPASINGQINPLASTIYTDLALSFRNMELTTFNPYSGKFAGYNIAKGKLTTELHYHIENRKLEAQHHIIVDQLEFGPATDSKQAVSLPIKLAVALLKDRNGVIDLDLPVSGSLDDPNFRIMPIVWKALVNTLTKAVTAPFALLGSLFRSGPEMQFVDFAPGSAELSAQQTEGLQKLARSLAERPQLKLDIPLTATSEADAMPLAQIALDRAVNELSPPQPGAKADALQQARIDALSGLYLKQFGRKPEFPPPSGGTADVGTTHQAWLEQSLLPVFMPNANRIQYLGRKRAEAVRASLMGSGAMAADRIFLTSSPQSEEAAKSAPPGTVRLELKLE